MSEDDFLLSVGVQPQPDLLRVSREAAKEMIAHNDADVFRLLPGGPEGLSAMDVIKSNGLWYSEYREFAIKRAELDGLDKWADRAAGDIQRQIQRDKHKSHEPEL